MNNLEDYQQLKGFQLEGSVVIGWKLQPDEKREFASLYIAGSEETISGLMEINDTDSEVKYNILVPVHQMENLTNDEKKNLVLENIQNEIWNWNEEYDFGESVEALFG